MMHEVHFRSVLKQSMGILQMHLYVRTYILTYILSYTRAESNFRGTFCYAKNTPE